MFTESHLSCRITRLSTYLCCMNVCTFHIGHLDLLVVAESSLPLPCFVHLVFQAAVNNAKLQLQTVMETFHEALQLNRIFWGCF